MLTLSPKEVENRDKILKELGYDLLADIEETACGDRSYHYEVYPTGIGDSIYLCFKGEKRDITDWENW